MTAPGSAASGLQVLCDECKVPAHDVCPMVDGCPCCDDTRERVAQEGR